jgi:ABC-type sugar transport system substrate-binding protein
LQIAAAKRAMIRHDGELIILDAQNDSIRQSQQLLDLIQSKTGRPDGIILDPVSRTGLPQAACAAAKAGIGWLS